MNIAETYNSLDLQRKVDQSKKFLDNVISTMDNLELANSGGKDSVVIYFIAKEVGYTGSIIHSNTTIDPDGTLGFIRKNMPDTQIIHPTESFYDLIKRKAFPTRINRFCCQILKENRGIGKNTIEGVRSAESTKRKGRDYIQCDNRKEMNGAKHIYPIYDWTDDDVWNYIHANNLPIAPCYSLGLKRLGCVGCPLITKKGQRELEYQLYPRRRKAVELAIKKGMESHPTWKISRYTDGDPEKAMNWWLTGKSMRTYFGYDIPFIRASKK